MLTPEEEKIKAHLIKVAKAPTTRTYQELCEECDLQYEMDDITDVGRLSNMLTRISKYEFGHDRPLLSIVIVNKTTKIPGDGFFKMCEEMKYGGWETLMNNGTFFPDMLKDCQEHWQQSL